ASCSCAVGVSSVYFFFFFSSRRRHTRSKRDWSSDVCSSDLEFYQKGLVAMWRAYETYQPDKGVLSTYFNYSIRHRLIDLIQKKRSEERRVGKEWKSRWSRNQYNKKRKRKDRDGTQEKEKSKM